MIEIKTHMHSKFDFAERSNSERFTEAVRAYPLYFLVSRVHNGSESSTAILYNTNRNKYLLPTSRETLHGATVIYELLLYIYSLSP